jgi:hypothetical protein
VPKSTNCLGVNTQPRPLPRTRFIIRSATADMSMLLCVR